MCCLLTQRQHHLKLGCLTWCYLDTSSVAATCKLGAQEGVTVASLTRSSESARDNERDYCFTLWQSSQTEQSEQGCANTRTLSAAVMAMPIPVPQIRTPRSALPAATALSSISAIRVIRSSAGPKGQNLVTSDAQWWGSFWIKPVIGTSCNTRRVSSEDYSIEVPHAGKAAAKTHKRDRIFIYLQIPCSGEISSVVIAPSRKCAAPSPAVQSTMVDAIAKRCWTHGVKRSLLNTACLKTIYQLRRSTMRICAGSARRSKL